jgi:ankyrin repeat protein
MSSTQLKQHEDPQKHMCGQCGQKPKKGVTFKVCSCGEPYCCIACQSKAWAEHKGPCKIKRKDAKAKSKVEEAATAAAAAAVAKEQGSGRGMGDMGSIMAALKLTQQQPTPQPQRYETAHLLKACLDDRYEELQTMMLQHGLDFNYAEPQTGATSAYISAERGNDRCLSLLAKHGAELSKANNEGFAPIHRACRYGRYACAEVLLDNGVDADLRTSDKSGDTPATIASISGQVKILALLLDRGSDPDLGGSDGLTPAHLACQFGQLKVLELLVKRGADVNKRGANGDTPLDYARVFKQRECVDLLILNGAVGMDMEDLSTVSKAQKVCAAASFGALSVRPIRHSHDVSLSIPPSGPNSRHHQSSERSAEGLKTVRVPIVPGQGEGRGGPAQVRWVQSGVVLQQGARCATYARARELLRRADSCLQLAGVRGASVRACRVSEVQGGDVLQ